VHVADPPVSELRWWLRPLFWLQRRRHGVHFTPAKVWARVPPLYAALQGFYAALERRDSPLEPALRSIVQTRVSQINHCAFCVDLNASISAQRSGSLDKVLAADRWRDSESFDARERLALEYAEAITRTDGRVGDALMTRLREHFDERSVIELTALVAFQNLSSKFNAALDIPAQGLCRIAPR
jgi:alkylhydroperoxidase family enzyme